MRGRFLERKRRFQPELDATAGFGFDVGRSERSNVGASGYS
jgi:hypothetical protein